MEHEAQVEANARWAQVSFQQLKALDLDGDERAELAAAGVSPRRIEALYPSRDYSELMPGIIDHLRANPGGITMWLVMESDPHFLTPTAPLSAGYHYGKEALYKEAQGFPSLHAFLSATTNYVTEEIQSVQSLLWHAHWMMSRRAELINAQQQTADKLMLASIEYILPSLKVSGQPRYF